MSDIRRRLEELKLKKELEKNRANGGGAPNTTGAVPSVGPLASTTSGNVSGSADVNASGNSTAARVQPAAQGHGVTPNTHVKPPSHTDGSSSSLAAPPSSSAASQILSQLPPSFTSPSSSVLKYRDPRTDPLCSHMTSSGVVSLFKRLTGASTACEEDPSEKVDSTSTSDPSSGSSSIPPAVQFYASVWKESGVNEAPRRGRKGFSAAFEAERNSMDGIGSECSACRSVNHYNPDKRLAQGVYGVVFSATAVTASSDDSTSSEKPMFALKQVKKQWLSESQVGFPPYLLREFDLLLRMRHRNVVRAHEVVLLDRAGDLDLSRWFHALAARRVRLAEKRRAKAKAGKKVSASSLSRRCFSFSTRERFQIAQEYRKDPDGLMQRLSNGLERCLNGSSAENVSVTTGSHRPSQSEDVKTTTGADSTSLSNLIYSPTFKQGDSSGAASAPNPTQTVEAKSTGSERSEAAAVVAVPPVPQVMPDTRAGITPGAQPPSKAKDVYLVMEYCKFDLKNYLFLSEACPQESTDSGNGAAGGARRTYLHLSSKNRHPDALNNYLSRIKCIAYQLFEGLAYLHEHRVIHRDLKSSNILVGSSKEDCGRIKIADFGLARCYREGQDLTQNVVTLLYRAPELHLAISDYSYGVDVWSAACIVCDLILKVPLFHSATVTNLLGSQTVSKSGGHRGTSAASYREEESELEHFTSICDIIGIPTDETFSALYKLPHAAKIMRRLPRFNRENRLRRLFARFFQTSPSFTQYAATGFSDSPFVTDFLDLLESIFKWNPMHRPSARDVLKHRFFTSPESTPCACDREELLTPLPFAFGASHGGTPSLRRRRATPQSSPPDSINIAATSEARHSHPKEESDATSIHAKRNREDSSEIVKSNSHVVGADGQEPTTTTVNAGGGGGGGETVDVLDNEKGSKRARSEQYASDVQSSPVRERGAASNMDMTSGQTSPMSTSNSDTSVELEALRDEQATPPTANEERRVAHSHHLAANQDT